MNEPQLHTHTKMDKSCILKLCKKKPVLKTYYQFHKESLKNKHIFSWLLAKLGDKTIFKDPERKIVP